jgi:Flp pilus assembly pilin Flp
MLKLQLFVRDLMDKLMGEEGQTATEYALVLVLVAIALAVALGLGLTGALNNVIAKITNLLT